LKTSVSEPVSWQQQHYAHADMELNIPRQSIPVSYCTAPWQQDDARPYRGMVLFLHGYGGLPNDAYTQNFRSYLAQKYEVLAVSIDYHASDLHPVEPARQFAVSVEDFERVMQMLPSEQADQLRASAYEVENRPGWIKFKGGQFGFFASCVSSLEVNSNDRYIRYLKVIADNLDQQNFGVMQALDILTVVRDISSTVKFDKNNIIAFGSSHGGYLAHLCNKIAPNTLRAVIDASSYPYTPLYLIASRPYVGVQPYFSFSRVLLDQDDNPIYQAYDYQYPDSAWELADASSPNYFGLAAMQIRNLNHQQHLQEVVKVASRKCQFRMIHSSTDEVFQPLEDKRNQAQRLIDSGFDVDFREMKESDIDGRLVKNLGHGMGCSMRALFDVFYPTIKPTESKLDFELGTALEFQCGDKIYRFDHATRPMLQITKHML
jgi:hypothetical protein